MKIVFHMKYSISLIAKIIKAESMNLNESEISILLTDSRSLTNPEETLFFAIKTHHNDGHKYIPELYREGVRNFVVRHIPPECQELRDINFLRVKDTVLALQELAGYHRHRFNIPVIGITGSNGKTIVKEWLYQLLNNEYNITRSPRSYNSQTGVPLSVWQLNPNTQLGIFEAGISRYYEMSRLEHIVMPTIGILTNIGTAHQENFSSVKEKTLEKLKLFRHAEVLIFNSDDHLIREAVLSSAHHYDVFCWSKTNREASLFIEHIEKFHDKTKIYFRYNEVKNRITIPFTDNASVENAISCLAVMLYLNKEVSSFEKDFTQLEPVAMRLEVKKGINNCILINDTYNSDINSLDIALDFMSRRFTEKRLMPVLILSDILQSGIPPAVFYRKVAELIEQKQIRLIIGVGTELSAQAGKFHIPKEFYPSTEALLKSGRINQLRDSIILLKGSRNFSFEKISEQLEEKVHETVLEVNLDAIVHNFKYFRSLLQPQTKTICMVKAFGYGVGSYELAKTLQEQGCDYLAVAVADEGEELRREGISMPVIVMNPEMHSFNTLIENRLEPEIYNFRILEAMLRETEKRNIVHYPVHIKLDTGMHRLGFMENDMDTLLSILKQSKSLKVVSIFSHLSASDNPEHDEYTRRQYTLFKKLTGQIESSLSYPVTKHILNSAGIERFPEYQEDMVRLGIGLYGISTKNRNLVNTVASLRTTILQIKELKKGDSIGYNRNWYLDRDSKIAVLPVGYADGLDRKLSNKAGEVLIHGKRCPIIGNICMDLCMVDITDTEAKEGDHAFLFNEELTIEEIAEKLNTIPYEILTSISPRVKRVYYKE